jgi:hypothetical protein
MTVSNRPIRKALALALAASAIAPAAGAARFELNPVPANPRPSGPPSARVVRISAPDGFDWGDAGIGAGAMAGLIGIGLGGTLDTKARRRRSRSRTRPA